MFISKKHLSKSCPIISRWGTNRQQKQWFCFPVQIPKTSAKCPENVCTCVVGFVGRQEIGGATSLWVVCSSHYLFLLICLFFQFFPLSLCSVYDLTPQVNMQSFAQWGSEYSQDTYWLYYKDGQYDNSPEMKPKWFCCCWFFYPQIWNYKKNKSFINHLNSNR